MRKKLIWIRDDCGDRRMWSAVPDDGRGYLIARSFLHGYCLFVGLKRLGDFATLAEAKRAAQQHMKS